MPRSELQLRGLAKDDCFPEKAKIVGTAHALASRFLANDEEQRYVPCCDLTRSEKLFEGGDLSSYASLSVNAASAPYLMPSDFVGPERRDGVDMGGEEDAGTALVPRIGE
jgi:hypothetical protein